MSRRRKTSALLVLAAASDRSPDGKRWHRKGGSLPDVRRWRQDVRPHLLRSVATAAHALSWSPDLLALLLDELHVDDELEKLLGAPLQKLRPQQYAEAVAIALILRHSWRADDLTSVLERLGIRV